ncbi:MAG: AsmA family protein, partial [Pseudomonadota bacterium]|nr:AsmA family protein [Pseudomonadota bacterium]
MSVWRSPVLYISILLVVVVAGLLSAPFLVDWNRYRATVEETGRQLTGRDVSVTGDISARLFPWPHIRLEGVRVANVPGTLISDVVRAEVVEARMLLGSLMGGRVEVSNIRIVKPVFSFERLDTSEVNWWLTPKLLHAAPVEAERVSIKDLEIVDGTVFISDTRRGGTAAFNGVDMSVSAQSLLGPWKAKGQLVQSGRPFSIGISTAAYKAGEPFGFTFRFSPVEGPGLVYTFDGAYAAASDEPLSGTITAEPYVAASGKSDSESKVRALVFKADIGFREDHALLRNIEIAPVDREHAGNILTGTAAIDLQERISVMADLHSPNYDLDAMLGSTGREVLKSGAFLDGLANFLEVLPGTLDGRVRLDIANLVVGGAKLEGTKLEAEISEGGLTLHELALTMPGQTKSRLVGKFIAGGEQPLLTGDLTIESANAREFFSWLMPEWQQAIAAAWTGARGKLDLTARLDHQPQSLKLTDARLGLDEAKAEGSLSMVGGPESQTTLRLAVDRLDVDRYLSEDAAVGDLK